MVMSSFENHKQITARPRLHLCRAVLQLLVPLPRRSCKPMMGGREFWFATGIQFEKRRR
jgi:hypothetical protein